MAEVKRHSSVFIGERTITFRGLRWSRSYGLTSPERWGDGKWLGSQSWSLHWRGRLARCRYGYRPPWMPAWASRAMTTVSRYCLPTVAGRHARLMARREHGWMQYADFARDLEDLRTEIEDIKHELGRTDTAVDEIEGRVRDLEAPS
jgi:hypothetical protein